MNLDYWQKQTKPLFTDLTWNIPEQPQGTITLLGGHAQNFRTVERTAAYLADHFPLQTITIALPDSLERKLPPLDNLVFLPSTASGSFAKSAQLRDLCNHNQSAPSNAELAILIGDFSKNTETATALTEFITHATCPLYLTRDTVDLVAPNADRFIDQPQINFIAPLVQIQTLLKSLYYPRMLLLSQPLLQIIETLHKFTLSYPCCITTFHAGQIVTAWNGQIITTPITNTNYSPISLWGGQLAANIATLSLYNPGKVLESSAAGVCYG